MTGLNNAISNNILTLLRQNVKKQNDLADALGVSKQIVSNMLSRNRMITAIELSQIAVFLGVTMERLMETSKEDLHYKEQPDMKYHVGRYPNLVFCVTRHASE